MTKDDSFVKGLNTYILHVLTKDTSFVEGIKNVHYILYFQTKECIYIKLSGLLIFVPNYNSGLTFQCK